MEFIITENSSNYLENESLFVIDIKEKILNIQEKF